MSTQRYSVTPHPVETLLTWVKSGEIAIPEIQRPFVWDATDVRNLLDSLYRGYPVGYLIAWRNPTVKLKDGTSSAGKRILIDGQQRVTALMAALLGREVLTKEYETVRIRIAFHPLEKRFEVANPAIWRDAAWLPDIAEVFAPDASLFQITRSYGTANPGVHEDEIFGALEKLRQIVYNHVGVIELADDLDIETVTEIFIRVNSAGAELSQADFAMSKIAVNEPYGGNLLRKAIDYFCHLAVAPDFLARIEKGDRPFAASEFLPQMRWLKDFSDDIYRPDYTDMLPVSLQFCHARYGHDGDRAWFSDTGTRKAQRYWLRVAFTSQFQRGRLQDLVALLSGRNFETKQFEDAIVEDSFARLKKGIGRFMNETDFKQFVMIVRSAGFVDSSLVTSQNTLNFAYILYLTLRDKKVPAPEVGRTVRRWLVMSMLTSRYSGAPEGAFDFDIKQMEGQGPQAYVDDVVGRELSATFWDTLLPQVMTSASPNSPYFRIFQAAQIKIGDRGFLSEAITVQSLVEVKSDLHHLFPADYLKKNNVPRVQINQIANFAVTQSEINIAISNKEPAGYFTQVWDQCHGGKTVYGNITDPDHMRANLDAHCIPAGIEKMTVADYQTFLAERRKLMARKLRTYFEGL